MNSHITDKFRKAFAELPADVQKQARQAYRLFMENPHHPSLRFKAIHSTRPIYSVRIGTDYRAVGIRDGGDIIWYWIGSHADYDKLIRQSGNNCAQIVVPPARDQEVRMDMEANRRH